MVCSSLKTVTVFYRINAYNQEQTSFKKIKMIQAWDTETKTKITYKWYILLIVAELFYNSSSHLTYIVHF